MQHEVFIQTARRARSLLRRTEERNLSWSTLYDCIFSQDISGKIQGTGIRVDYCDPDTSYEEDVRAFVKAINAKADELEELFTLLEEDNNE